MTPTTSARRRGPVPGTVALVLFLVPLLPASAETFLIAVTETEDGTPCRAPLAAREGILAALFDDGHIAFEVSAGEPVPGTDALRTMAIEAGAGTVAVIVVDWHREQISGGATRIRARGSIALVDVASGLGRPGIPFEVRNDGRERTADRPLLGREIGSALVEACRASSAAR